MVMKINIKEFIKELDNAPENLEDMIAVLLDNAKDLTADELRKFHLPSIDIVASMKAKKMRLGYDFAPLQPTKISSPEVLKNVKYAPNISKHDAALLTMGKCVDTKLCSAKDFLKKAEKEILKKTQNKQIEKSSSKKPLIMGVQSYNEMG